MTTITCRTKMSSSPILSRRQLVLFEVLCIVTSSNVKEDGNRRQGCTTYIMAREAPTTPNGKPGAPTLILTQAFPSSRADRLCWASPPTVVSANLTSCAIHGLLVPPHREFRPVSQSFERDGHSHGSRDRECH